MLAVEVHERYMSLHKAGFRKRSHINNYDTRETSAATYIA